MEDSLENILSDYAKVLETNCQTDQDIEQINKKVEARIAVCDNTDNILDDATKEFNGLTSIINKKDIPFFVFSLLLQGAVKYTIKAMREMSDKELAKKTPLHNREHSSRQNNRYYSSIEEIISNPVPFDAISKSHETTWYAENGVDAPGFSGLNHRTKALGHDPLLGLIFGTANILTSTITRNDLRSWHVETLGHLRQTKLVNLDTIDEEANTLMIFSSIVQRLQSEGKDGWEALGCAFLKEIVHLQSDLPSKQSLPIPVVSVFSEKLARQLSMYGLNTGTLVQGSLSLMVINWAIAFLHGLCKSKDDDEKLYEVRTQKIITYSNTLATVSDIGISMFMAYNGDKNAMRKFDLGGYMVTLYQISHSFNVISHIEREFYTNKIITELNKTNY